MESIVTMENTIEKIEISFLAKGMTFKRIEITLCRPEKYA